MIAYSRFPRSDRFAAHESVQQNVLQYVAIDAHKRQAGQTPGSSNDEMVWHPCKLLSSRPEALAQGMLLSLQSEMIKRTADPVQPTPIEEFREEGSVGTHQITPVLVDQVWPPDTARPYRTGRTRWSPRHLASSHRELASTGRLPFERPRP
jgi:hypothetical protein